MYGKVFASMYTGSMYGAGAVVFAVWTYALAKKDAADRVDLNPQQVADSIGCSQEEVIAALAYLTAPDGGSRSKEHDGRRLIREGEYQHWVVNGAKYRSIRVSEDVRAYNRLAQRRSRARRKARALSPSDQERNERRNAACDAALARKKELNHE